MRLVQTVVIGAFKVVIELEIKRRDNDKKVKLLFLEMRNMMSALLQYVPSSIWNRAILNRM